MESLWGLSKTWPAHAKILGTLMDSSKTQYLMTKIINYTVH